jgi:quercetin 2,3-dioxygenase
LVADGDPVSVSTGNDHVRLLLISEKPLKEPVAWYGPIGINTEDEISPLSNDTFIKYRYQ